MAKQYIPGVSGLLTEPNPVDSPSNTLSEAENVVVEQRGKIQARHGFNIDDNNRYSFINTANSGIKFNNNISYTDDYTNKTRKTCLIGKNSQYNCVITIPNHGLLTGAYIRFTTTGQLPDTGSGNPFDRLQPDTTYIVQNIDANTFSLKSLAGYFVNIGTAEQYGTHYAYHRLQLGYIDTNTVDFAINQYEVINSQKNNALMNSFFNTGDTYFKFLEFKNSKDTVITGLIVKQNKNEYVIKEDGGYREFVVNRPVTDPVFRYYQISKDGTKVINTGSIPFTKVENIFKTDESLYLQTENGLVESNLDDLFRPTNDRFFKVSWPNFVKLKHKLIDSDLFGNWLLAGKKIGVRYVYYRESGYNQNEGDIYYSEPSQIYEIINDSKNAIPQIYLDFSTFISNTDEYKKWNLFTQYNNGRKFGIILYRTVVTDIADNEGNYNPLPVEFYACTDKIPFDTLITSEIQTVDLSNNVTFLPHRELSIYRPLDTRGEYNEGDILSYIPNNTSNSGRPLSSGYVYSKKNIRFKEDKLDLNDILTAQLKVSKKIKDSNAYESSVTPQCSFSEFDSLSSTNEIRLNYGQDGTSAKRYSYGCNYKNCEKNSEFINTVIIRLKQEFKNALFNTGKVGVEIWEYDEKTRDEYTAFPYPRLINKIGNAEINMTDYPLNITTNKNAAYASDISRIYVVPAATLGLSIESSGNIIAEWFYDGTNPSYAANNLLPIIINGITYTVTFPDTSIGKTGTQYTAAQIVTQINSVLGANGTAAIVNLGGSSTSILRITATTGSIRLSSGSANSILKFGNFQTTGQDDWNFIFKLEKTVELVSNKSYMIVLVEDSLYEANLSGSFYTNYAQFYYKTYPNYYSQKYDVMRFSWSELTSPQFISTIFFESDNNPLTKFAFGFARIEPIYRYQLTAVNDITTQNGSVTTLSTGAVLSNDKGALWKDRYLIKSYNFDLALNDDSVISLPVIYTDSNKDADYNEIAPVAKSIIPFKDFYIYAGVTDPLTATIYPVEQPYVSQIKFGLLTTSNILQNGFQFANRNEFVTTGRTLPDIVVDSSINGEVYLDSAIFPDRSVNVKVLDSSRIKTTNYNVGVNHYDEANDSIPIQVTNLNAAALTPANVASFFEIEGTIFEKPYVTLRLTSRSGKVDIVSVQVEPIYNRRGYYSKKNELNEYDDNHLQFNLSLNEGNAFKYTATDGTFTIERQGLTLHNVPGNGNNQLKPAGTHKQTAYNITDSNAANKIYLANNVITLRAIDTFDITQFQSPGILMIQRAPDANNISDVAIFDYAVVRVSSANSNFIEFTGATLKYVTENGIPQNVATAKNGTIISISDVSLYYLTGTTIQNLELYAYNTPELKSAAVEITSTGNKRVVERYNRDFFSRPGNTTSGSNSITNIQPSTTGIKIGMSISGTGIPSGATVSSIAGTNSITISANATATNTAVLLTFISTHVNQPTFTFAKHNKKTANTVGKFADTGNHLFYGNYGTFGLDEYGWQLVNKFNKEFIARGINAVCRKVPGLAVGGFQIEYPDGAKIEMVNGKYDIVNNQPTITYPGKHTFIPDINKKRFTTLAEYSPLQYRSNVALVSRRDLPEVVTSKSDIIIGRGDKEYIGHAKQVDDLYIFREDGIYRITDEGSKNPPLLDIPSVNVTQFSTNVICQAAGSIQEINDEIIFLSQFGFTSIKDGGIDYIISEPIKSDILKLLETSPKDRIRSFANASKNLYYCTLVNEVDANLDVKTGTYIFNTVTRQWTFTDNEILDGMEDTEHRNLVAYRQKSINAIHANYIQFRSDNLTDDTYTYLMPTFNFSYPLTTSKFYNNFYSISRETHTNGISTNALDQYDFISRRFDLSSTSNYTSNKGKQYTTYGTSTGADQFKEILWKSNGFTVVTLLNGLDYTQMPTNSAFPHNYSYTANRGMIFSYFLPKANSMSTPVNGIRLYPSNYTNTETVVFDSFVQYFYNRDVKVKFYSPTPSQNFTGTVEFFSIKLKNISYDLGTTNTADPSTVALMFTEFEFISAKPSWWDSTMSVTPAPGYTSNWSTYDNFGYMIDGFEILAGVPVKITFNPESLNTPDTNKLFQEYMIHTETNNKAMAMAFKTDSRVNFTNDRRFAYDATATKRNVFRTYIPTDAARGRYLIRQVKHDVPLENLIITGQTIVMRDTSSTRVQKDKD